jgi:hypothetical protein
MDEKTHVREHQQAFPTHHAVTEPVAKLEIQRQPAGTLAYQQARYHPRSLSPTAMKNLQHTIGNQAVVQLLAGQAAEKTDAGGPMMRQVAQNGTQTPSGRLPYGGRIQRAFGRHDISHIQAHLGQEATGSAQAMQALAYTSGSHIVFAGTPNLHTAAHEATHVVQQRSGIQLSDGIGRVGDRYEQQADAVAQRVTAGQSAEGLLDQVVEERDKASENIYSSDATSRETKYGIQNGGRTDLIQRKTFLKDFDKAMYGDTSDDKLDLSYAHKQGLTSLPYFIPYAQVKVIQDTVNEAMAAARKLYQDMNMKANDDFLQKQVIAQLLKQPGPKNLIGTLYFEDGKGNLTSVDLTSAPDTVELIVANVSKSGPMFRPEGGGSRLPSAKGLIFTENATAQEVFAELSLKSEEKFSEVHLWPLGAPYKSKLSKAQTDGENLVVHTNPNFYYVSQVKVTRRPDAIFRAAGNYYDETFSEVNATTVGPLITSFTSLTPPKADTNWQQGNAFGTTPRQDQQDAVMGKWNALGAAAFAKHYYGRNYDLNQNWEWLHIQGAQIGGATVGGNLVPGLFVVNSAMIPFENLIKSWANQGAQKMWARFIASQPESPGPFVKKIIIAVYATGHKLLGTIPDTNPLIVEFEPLTGRVVDKLTQAFKAKEWQRQIESKQPLPTTMDTTK